MTRVRAAIWGLAGVVAGAAAALGLGIAYGQLVDFRRGHLAVPFAIVAAAGIGLSVRRATRHAGVGVVAGAGAETWFFLYLFDQLGTG